MLGQMGCAHVQLHATRGGRTTSSDLTLRTCIALWDGTWSCAQMCYPRLVGTPGRACQLPLVCLLTHAPGPTLLNLLLK